MERPQADGLKPRVRMITPVWGAAYIERWLDLCLAAQRAEGNLPYLNRHTDFEMVVATRREDIAYMKGSPRFQAMTSGLRVRYVVIDELFPARGSTPYGVPLTLAYAKAIREMGDDAIGAFVMIMNADCMVADGGFRSIVERIREGYTIICSTSVRTVDGFTRAELQKRVRTEDGVLSIAPREMARLALSNLHSTVSGRIVNQDCGIDSNYYHQIFWRVSDDCIAMRGFMVHPLCFRIDRRMDKVLCPVDYGFMIEMAPQGRFCVIGDSDDYIMLEFQARDSEAHWLRIAPLGLPLEQRLARLTKEITDHAATWTTSEHRRYATQTILYHAADLPSDLAERLAPFHAFIDEILERLPSPISHIGHFQWLPAVRFYRQDMIKGGRPEISDLLDDPRNDEPAPPVAEPVAQRPSAVPPSQPPRNPLAWFFWWARRSFAYRGRKMFSNVAYRFGVVIDGPEMTAAQRRIREFCSKRVTAMIAERVGTAAGQSWVSLVVGDAARDCPPPRRGERVIHIQPSASGNLCGRGTAAFAAAAAAAGRAVVIYARAGFLCTWASLGEDVEALLKHAPQVFVVLIQEDYARLSVSGHAYMLSILLSCLCRPQVAMDVRILTAPGADGDGDSDEPPSEFSAMVISVRRHLPAAG